jgi:Flp pilus assembly protein TadD
VTDTSGQVDYVIGIRALVARNYRAAAQAFAQAERRGFQDPTLRPLLAYALCLAEEFDLARRLVPAASSDPESGRFWTWLVATFGLAMVWPGK